MTSVWISWILKCTSKPLSGFFRALFYLIGLSPCGSISGPRSDVDNGIEQTYWICLLNALARSPMCGKKGEKAVESRAKARKGRARKAR